MASEYVVLDYSDPTVKFDSVGDTYTVKVLMTEIFMTKHNDDSRY